MSFSFSSDFIVKGSLGIGTWAWGADAWEYKPEQKEDCRAAYHAARAEGICFFDTAEVYGDGISETLLGEFMAEDQTEDKANVIAATKFLPMPSYFRSKNLKARFELSRARLNVDNVPLYQIHGMMASVRSVEVWCSELISLFNDGLIKNAGVSNFTRGQVQRAHKTLSDAGVPLVSNQVEYSLLRRNIEFNGVLDECNARDIKIIAYSPLGMGRLTGKYGSENPPPARKFGNVDLKELDALLDVIREIADNHQNENNQQQKPTPAQISLAWVIHKGAFPIVGARNAKQATENARAMHIKLSKEEMDKLDKASMKCQSKPSFFTRLWQD